jgi:signal peptidase I
MTPLLCGLAALVAALVVLVRRYLVRVEISGTSMRPTFEPGDRVLALRVAPSRIRTGDVIVLDSPAGTEEGVQEYLKTWTPSYEVVERDPPIIPAGAAGPRWVIKRVAAVAGEPVPFPIPRRPGDAVVPTGSVVVLGDNGDASVDSRHHGYVPLDRIFGKVL